MLPPWSKMGIQTINRSGTNDAESTASLSLMSDLNPKGIQTRLPTVLPEAMGEDQKRRPGRL